MNPSDELKAAAEHIREVAKTGTPGPWREDGTEIYGPHLGTWVGETLDADDGAKGIGNAAHIALWDPTVAELVANVFDQWAWMVEKDFGLIHRIGGPETLALARAINGGA